MIYLLLYVIIALLMVHYDLPAVIYHDLAAYDHNDLSVIVHNYIPAYDILLFSYLLVHYDFICYCS